MESCLATSWIDLATATAHQKLMGNVPTMESAEKCVVYKATCRICDKSYIGQTQQKLKDRMGQHLNSYGTDCALCTTHVFVMMFHRQELVIHLLAFCPADFLPMCPFPLGTPSDAIILDQKIVTMAPPPKPAPTGCLRDNVDMSPSKEHSPNVGGSIG
jgi:hypothetical protein